MQLPECGHGAEQSPDVQVAPEGPALDRQHRPGGETKRAHRLVAGLLQLVDEAAQQPPQVGLTFGVWSCGERRGPVGCVHRAVGQDRRGCLIVGEGERLIRATMAQSTLDDGGGQRPLGVASHGLRLVPRVRPGEAKMTAGWPTVTQTSAGATTSGPFSSVRSLIIPASQADPTTTGRVRVIVMAILIIGLTACGVVPEPPPTTPSVTVPATAEGPLAVQRVVDGDTVWVLRDGVRVKLRLIGIDTPETVDPRKPVQCFGREASAQAKRLLDGAEVFIEKDPSQSAVDRYGRELVYLWTSEGTFFNLEMITTGYALEYTYDLPYAHQEEFRAAQRSAEDAERGLWDPASCSGDVEQPAR